MSHLSVTLPNLCYCMFLIQATLCRPSLDGVQAVAPSNGRQNGQSRAAALSAGGNGTPANDDGDAISLAIKKLCRLPSEAGTCSQTIQRFYYSPHSKHCLEFVYGGCQGNENNFDNITECQDTCAGVKPCPYVPWVPGCKYEKKGEDSDGCATFDMACEQKDKTTEAPATSPTSTSVRSSTVPQATTGLFGSIDIKVVNVQPNSAQFVVSNSSTDAACDQNVTSSA